MEVGTNLRSHSYFVNVIKATEQEIRIMYVHLFWTTNKKNCMTKRKSNGRSVNTIQIIQRQNIVNGSKIRTRACHMWEYIRHYSHRVVFDPMYFIWDVRLEKD